MTESANGPATESANGPVIALSDPAAPLEQPAEYAFGSDTRIEDVEAERAANAVVAQAVPSLTGKPRVRYWVAPAGFDVGGLRPGYDAQAKAGGWRAIPDFAKRLGPGRDGFAYGAGDRAFALIWLKRPTGSADGADGRIPVTVVRYGAGG